MFIEKRRRRFSRFDMHDNEDVRAYEELINDPGIEIIERKQYNQEESNFDNEGGSTSETRLYMYVEYFECSL